MNAKLKIHPINMIIFGPPGVGKGSYTKMLKRDLNIKAFSSGDFFRQVLSKDEPKDEYMMEIEKNLHSGALINDDIMNQVILHQLHEAKHTGIILDGYPRTISQAKFL